MAATTPVGTYTVHLEVEDTKGNIVADDFTVTVAAVPVFTAVPASPQTAKVGTTVNLSATVNPGTATVNWIPGGPVQGAQTGGTAMPRLRQENLRLQGLILTEWRRPSALVV